MVRAMKHSPLFVLATAVAVLAGSGCGHGKDASTPAAQVPVTFDLAGTRKVIEENNRRFTRAHVTGDQAAIDAMFTREARVLPPGADPVIGREAVARLTAEYIAFGVAEFREDTTDFYGNEDILIDQGNYVMAYGKDKTRESGKYLNVWKKEDGAWKIYSNIWNTNAPPAPVK